MPGRKRAIDEATEYRDRVIKEAIKARPSSWSIPGLQRHPNQRVIFLQMLPKEKLTRLLKAISAYAKSEGAYERGFAALSFCHSQWCVLNLPTGEKLISVCCTRYPATLAEERSLDVGAILDFTVTTLQQFGQKSGRLSAILKQDSQLMVSCSDGRHIPMAACIARPPDPEE